MAKKGSLFSLSEEHKERLQILAEHMSDVRLSMTEVLEELIDKEYYKRKLDLRSRG